MAIYKDVEPLEVVAYKGESEDFDRGVTFILEQLDALPTADVAEVKWSDVNERLPERQGRYLTHSIIAGQSLVAILWYEKYGVGFDEEVTHWMPLPEPPSGAKMDGGKAE